MHQKYYLNFLMLKQAYLIAISLFFFCCHSWLFSQEEDVEKTLPATHAFAKCAACHGIEGEGNQKLFAPKLNGQHLGYLKKQIESFKNGWRGTDPKDTHGLIMAAAVKDMDNHEINKALEYLDSIKDEKPGKRIFGDRWRGESLYEKGCAICHGEKGEGSIQYSMARLDMQHGWYLMTQLKHFRKDVRGTHNQDESGKTMAFYAKLLPDDQAVEDIVSWLTYSSRKRYREKLTAAESEAN